MILTPENIPGDLVRSLFLHAKAGDKALKSLGLKSMIKINTVHTRSKYNIHMYNSM